MSANAAANLLLIVAAVVWILARQLRAEPIKARLLVAAPLLLGYFGLRSLDLAALASPVDASLLAGALTTSLGFGLWRGTTIRVWHDAAGAWMRQGSWLTLALWGALFAVRGVEYVLGRGLGHPGASGAGVLLVSLAVSFAAQNAVTLTRMHPIAGPLAATR